MKNMAFSMTTAQVKARTKTVTRRLGWRDLQAGEQLCAIEKGQGLKKGEKVNRLGVIEVVSARPEPLDAITQEDVVLEGFPQMTPAEFVAFFARGHRCEKNAVVNRIEFKYV
jgi:hypothetical protein